MKDLPKGQMPGVNFGINLSLGTTFSELIIFRKVRMEAMNWVLMTSMSFQFTIFGNSLCVDLRNRLLPLWFSFDKAGKNLPFSLSYF